MSKLSIIHCKNEKWYAFIARFIQKTAIANNQYPINHTALLFEHKNKKYVVYELKKHGNIFTEYDNFIKRYKGEIWETAFTTKTKNIDLKKIIKSKKFKYSFSVAISAFDFKFKYQMINGILDAFAKFVSGNYNYCTSSVIVILKLINDIEKNEEITKYLESIKYDYNEQTPADLFEYCKKNISVVRIK